MNATESQRLFGNSLRSSGLITVFATGAAVAISLTAASPSPPCVMIGAIGFEGATPTMARSRISDRIPPATVSPLPSSPNRFQLNSPARNRFHGRPTAPLRIGSSMRFHESAATPKVAPTWRTERTRLKPLAPKGVVRVMIGNCHK